MAVILVTGANRGIGYGIVQAYATHFTNTTIILGCRVLENGLEAIQRLGILGVKAELDVLQIDIDDNESVAAAAKSVKAKHGRLDGKIVFSIAPYTVTDPRELLVLVNNAASVSLPTSNTLGELRSNSNAIFNNCVSSNIVVTEAFMPLLRRSEHPRAIFTSSARGSLGRTASNELPPTRLANYCVSKAALNMLVLQLKLAEEANESAVPKVTFWSVSPGHTKTGFNSYRGTKDPLQSAEAYVKLLESEADLCKSGTFWELENGQFREVPW